MRFDSGSQGANPGLNALQVRHQVAHAAYENGFCTTEARGSGLCLGIDAVQRSIVHARDAPPHTAAKPDPASADDGRWTQAIGINHGASRSTEKAIHSDVVPGKEAEARRDDTLLCARARTLVGIGCGREQAELLVDGRKLAAPLRLPKPNGEFDDTRILDIRLAGIERFDLAQLGDLFTGDMNDSTARRPRCGHQCPFVPAGRFAGHEKTGQLLAGSKLADSGEMGGNCRRRIHDAPVGIRQADVAVQELFADVDREYELTRGIDAGPCRDDIHGGAECALDCDWTHREGSEAPSFCPALGLIVWCYGLARLAELV